MSYATINKCANDQAFIGRLTASCAQEERPPDPSTAAYEVRWYVSSRSDIESAFASALAANNPDPGGDESVVTDQMILSAVQAAPPAPTP
jgi:hypothetical protein